MYLLIQDYIYIYIYSYIPSFNISQLPLPQGIIAWQVQFASYGINAAKYAAELLGPRLGLFFFHLGDGEFGWSKIARSFETHGLFNRCFNRPFTGGFAGSAPTKDGILLRGFEVGWPKNVSAVGCWFPATKVFYSVWSPPWHFKTYIWNYLDILYILIFFPSLHIRHLFRHSDILFGFLSGICSGILFDVLSYCLAFWHFLALFLVVTSPVEVRRCPLRSGLRRLRSGGWGPAMSTAIVNWQGGAGSWGPARAGKEEEVEKEGEEEKEE